MSDPIRRSGESTPLRVLAPRPAEPVAPTRTPPTFSVVIAAFQVADVIADALDSVFAQTLPPVDVVVCDDGSTDEIDEALAPFRDRIVFTRKENGGEGSAKNEGVRRALGDFVAFLDADDVYLPTRLEALAELACARPDLDLLTTDAWLEANGQRVRRCYSEGWTFEAVDQRRAILERNFVFGHVAVRRERFVACGGFDESIRRTTDWDCWLRMILDGARVGAVMEPLSLYRVRETSLSADRRAMLEGKIGTLEKAATNPAVTDPERRVLERALARYRAASGVEQLRATLVDGGRALRRSAARVAVSRHASTRVRAEAALAVLSPALVGAVHRRRAARFWVGAGGVRVERDVPASSER